MYKLTASLRCCIPALNQQRQIFIGIKLAQQQQPKQQEQPQISQNEVKAEYRTDDEWLNAKDFNKMPGPTTLRIIRDFLPGGELHKRNLVDINKITRKRYGDIFRVKGFAGQPDAVITYNAKDIEKTYRNEGIWPHRITLETLKYFRLKKRPDVYKGCMGLVPAQGKEWAEMRNKVNPVMLKIKNVRQYLPKVDQISMEFMERLESVRDPTTGFLQKNFQDELKMWAFESISCIAFNTRLNVINGKATERALQISKYMADFLQYGFEYDILPSFWKYIETRNFKRLMRAHDNLTNVATSYINEAMEKFEQEEHNKQGDISALEQLCLIDKSVAIVMAIDMLLAGMDTTSAALLTTIYQVAKNPKKQDILHRELRAMLPDPDQPLTEAHMKNLPYLRACFKEGQRITPVVPINSRILPTDMVLSGYRIPKGTAITMNNMELCHMEEYFPQCKEFMPERWLKSGETACPSAKTSNPFVFLPFGFGPRTCIGRRIAEMEMETLLVRLFRKFRISWEEKEEMQYLSNLILTAHGNIKFKFEPIPD